MHGQAIWIMIGANKRTNKRLTMTKKLGLLIGGMLLLAGLLPLIVLAGAEGALALVSIVDLKVTVDQEILCNPCSGTLHWDDAADSSTPIYADDNDLDHSFTYAQAGCYEPVLVVLNSETLEEASYSVGPLAVGTDAVCEAPPVRLAFFPQVILQDPPHAPTPTPTPPPTPTPTPPPSDCDLLPIGNPSFEETCVWDLSGKLDPWYTTEQHQSGLRSLGMGVRRGEDDDLAAYSQASQWITIPADASELRGYFYSVSEESSATGLSPAPQSIDEAVETDTIFLYLMWEYDDVIRRVLWKPNYDHRSWESFEVDVSLWRGQTILLMFGMGTDGDGYASRVYFDNFSIR